MHARILLLFVLIIAAIAASSGAREAQANHGYVMPWETFQPRGWDKYYDSNRLLRERCRPTFDGMTDFAGKPLSDVLPGWRHVKLDRLRAKRERIRDRSSLCWPAHHSLWLCIHSREGDWEDGGWPYWGGLQMGAWFLSTYLERFAPSSVPPAGNVGPNGWTNAASQYAQEAAAEAGYRASGYSRAWLFGQWPNTAPPCV